jgi:CheY-like chemotaxis protein
MLTGERILIVEDEALIGVLLEDSVREAGAADVVVATTAGTALRAVGVQKTTLAILDVNLGTETSLSVAEKLKRRGVPFVYHTARCAADLHGWPDAPLVRKPDLDGRLMATLTRLQTSTADDAPPTRNSARESGTGRVRRAGR